jgi:uncharacterized protein (TIRG00374 family)
VTRARAFRIVATPTLTALCVAYVVWKIDIHQTVQVLRRADAGYFGAAVTITIVAILPLAWRWQRLLAARGLDEPLGWLTKTLYASYAFAQVLPTSLGGDASRIYSTVRKHREEAAAVTGSVVLERALGGVATLTLAAVGFVVALGRYDIGPYLWIEAAIAAGTLLAAAVVFSRRTRRPLARLVPLLRRLRVERPIRAVYEGLHGYRDHGGLLASMFALTLAVQVFRVFAIWLVGKSVGVDLSPRPYFVLGPMLFLVMLVPFTVNGIALREAFFVNFLGQLGVGADAAFATGFLFFLLSVATAVPGALLLLADALFRRPARTPGYRART